MSSGNERTLAPMLVIGGLIALHFLFRPLLVQSSLAPDLLAGALLLAALRLRAGHVAALGFVLGLLEGAMAVMGIGALAVIYTLGGYAGARSWDLFFADVRLFLPVYLLLGTWALQLAVSSFVGPEADWRLILIDSPVSAALTAIVCGFLATFMEGRARA